MLSLDTLKSIKCPNCKTLSSINEEFHCSECEAQYASFNGVPWLYANMDESIGFWQDKSKRLYDYLSLKKLECDRGLDQESREASQRRLEGLSQAYKESAEQLKALLPDFISEDHQSSTSFQYANQSLESYFYNIFRDWAWGSDENQKHIEPLLELLKDQSLGKTIVLGSGSSRFAYDLQESLDLEKLVLLDINPLLLLTAKSLIAEQKAFDLTEVALSPKSIEDSSKKWSLQAPNKPSKEIEFVFSDAMNLIFNNNSFNTVVTPWFLDVIPQSADEFLKRINLVLEKGGRWIYFGPSAFNKSDEAEKISAEELKELAQVNGFKVIDEKIEEVPYLQSPLSGQKRVEQVLYLICEKEKNAKQPAEFFDRPQWMLDFNLPIQKEPWLEQKMVESKIYFEVLSAVDGTRSINQLIQLVSAHYGMTPEMAEESLVKYFNTLYFEQ